jgi:hypothetical protein
LIGVNQKYNFIVTHKISLWVNMPPTAAFLPQR